jgi:galactokinase/mevalonate kinase-like predicted kinase
MPRSRSTPYGTLRRREDDRIRIESVELGVVSEHGPDEPLPFDGRLDLVKAAIQNVGDRSVAGFNLLPRHGAPPGSGLGSSSR